MHAYDSLLQRSREIAVYNSAASLLSWDQETYMPPKAGAYRAEQLSQLVGFEGGVAKVLAHLRGLAIKHWHVCQND